MVSVLRYHRVQLWKTVSAVRAYNKGLEEELREDFLEQEQN
jgi:hypothetical protein